MYLWTSEAVSSGHPDKVADQIADTVLDAYLKVDPYARVACEVTLCRDLVLVTGEVASKAQVQVEPLVRQTICDIGYDRPEHSYDGATVELINRIGGQSGEIAKAVIQEGGQIGAGDQGIMFGFACDETGPLMPLTHHLAFELIGAVERDIASGRSAGKWESAFLPDAKSQVTVEYDDDGCPLHVHTALLSVQHRKEFALGDLRAYVNERVIGPLRGRIPLFDDKTKYLINPAMEWHVGGPAADTGLSGRKIVVDNYGADCPIGGGSFSGKDPTKVDRSAAYAARHVAKNLVAAGLARRARVQLSYAIGIAEPTSIRVESTGGPYSGAVLTEMVRSTVDLTPKGIIDRLELRKPVYRRTASGGHFGRPEFTWERLHLVDTFRNWSGRQGN